MFKFKNVQSGFFFFKVTVRSVFINGKGSRKGLNHTCETLLESVALLLNVCVLVLQKSRVHAETHTLTQNVLVPPGVKGFLRRGWNNKIKKFKVFIQSSGRARGINK